MTVDDLRSDPALAAAALEVAREAGCTPPIIRHLEDYAEGEAPDDIGEAMREKKQSSRIITDRELLTSFLIEFRLRIEEAAAAPITW